MVAQERGTLGKALDFLDELEEVGIHYELKHVRNSLMIEISIPGQRIEVEFFDDSDVEVERFVSAGELEGQAVVDKIIQEYREEIQRDRESAKQQNDGEQG